MLHGVGWLMPHPNHFTPGNDPVPTVQEAGGLQGQSGWTLNFSPHVSFNPLTIQPAASCYTRYSNLAKFRCNINYYIKIYWELSLKTMMKTKLLSTELCLYLAPPCGGGGGRKAISWIWADSLFLMAVCCWTRTSAASAKSRNVFLSQLSSTFRQPTHLQLLEQGIFAWK